MAHNNYTMSTYGLPDMYTLSPRASGVEANHLCSWYNYNIRNCMIYIGITDVATEQSAFVLL